MRWVFNFPCKSWDGWFYQIRMEPFQALVSPKWWWWWWWGRWSNLIFADKIWDSIFVHIEFTVFPLKCTTFHQNVLFFLLQFLEFNLKLSPHQFSPRTQSATKYEVCRWVTNIRFEVWGMWYAMGEKYEVWGMRCQMGDKCEVFADRWDLPDRGTRQGGRKQKRSCEMLMSMKYQCC